MINGLANDEILFQFWSDDGCRKGNEWIFLSDFNFEADSRISHSADCLAKYLVVRLCYLEKNEFLYVKQRRTFIRKCFKF